MHSILRTSNFINGKWTTSGAGFLPIKNKFTGELIAEVPLAGSAEMEEAIASSVTALQALSTHNAGMRFSALGRMAQLLESKKEAFAQLIVAEAGKPLSYARTEVFRCITTLTTAMSEGLRFGGEYVPINHGIGVGRVAYTRRFPIGPVAAISPFNFPLNLAMHKIAPALAVGCPVVLKPAPQAPLTALAFAALAKEAGLPPGALSILLCDTPVAEILVRDERMKMLSFTGSPAVGWHLKNIAGRKKVALELGGNAAVIVDETADIEDAAKQCATGCFLYAGQVCISTQRIYVVESVKKVFVEKLLDYTATIKSGDPTDPQVINGPIIDTNHLHRISSWVNEAVNAGATLLCGGKILDERHNVYAPTLLTGTKPDMKVVSQEVFGPVGIVEGVADFEEALRHVNDSEFGLQAGVFTDSVTHMKRAHEALEVGGVIINSVPGFRVDSMPYGGIKSSGLGREGVRYTMEEMTEPRLMVY